MATVIKYQQANTVQVQCAGHTCDIIGRMASKYMSEPSFDWQDALGAAKSEKAAEEVRAQLGTTLAVAEVRDAQVQTVGSKSGGIQIGG